jgi:hypothetical protein
MPGDPYLEVRGDFPREHVEILDVYAQHTPGSSRIDVLRKIVAEWVAREVHRASLVHVAAARNGLAPGSRRRTDGSRGE